MSEPVAAEPWYSFSPPRLIETSRLELRAWDRGQATLLKAAIDANLKPESEIPTTFPPGFELSDE